MSTQHAWKFLASKAVGLLEVFIDDLHVPLLSTPIDLGKALHLPDGKAYVGFTSSTAEYFEVTPTHLMALYCDCCARLMIYYSGTFAKGQTVAQSLGCKSTSSTKIRSARRLLARVDIHGNCIQSRSSKPRLEH